MTQPDSSLCPSELMHACQQMLLAATPKAVYRQLAGIIDHHFDLDACCVTSMSDGQQFLYGREDTDAIDRVHTRTCTQAFVRIPGFVLRPRVTLGNILLSNLSSNIVVFTYELLYLSIVKPALNIVVWSL